MLALLPLIDLSAEFEHPLTLQFTPLSTLPI
jgi:hypothetical protein